MGPSVGWQLLKDVRDGLRTLTFARHGGDPVSAIRPTAIVIRKMPSKERPHESGHKNDPTPGVLIGLANARRHPSEGTNVRDDVVYTIIIQIIDRDNNTRGEDGLQSYIKWQEQIAKYLNAQLRDDVQTYDEGQVCIAHAVTTNHIDERMWSTHRLMVGAVILQVRVREPRG